MYSSMYLLFAKIITHLLTLFYLLILFCTNCCLVSVAAPAVLASAGKFVVVFN